MRCTAPSRSGGDDEHVVDWLGIIPAALAPGSASLILDLRRATWSPRWGNDGENKRRRGAGMWQLTMSAHVVGGYASLTRAYILGLFRRKGERGSWDKRKGHHHNGHGQESREAAAGSEAPGEAGTAAITLRAKTTFNHPREGSDRACLDLAAAFRFDLLHGVGSTHMPTKSTLELGSNAGAIYLPAVQRRLGYVHGRLNVNKKRGGSLPSDLFRC